MREGGIKVAFCVGQRFRGPKASIPSKAEYVFAYLYDFCMRIFSSEGSSRSRAGELAPQSGIYRVYHRAHRLPHNVYVNAGSRLTLCRRCGRDCEFGLLMAGPDLQTDFDFSRSDDDAISA